MTNRKLVLALVVFALFTAASASADDAGKPKKQSPFKATAHWIAAHKKAIVIGAGSAAAGVVAYKAASSGGSKPFAFNCQAPCFVRQPGH